MVNSTSFSEIEKKLISNETIKVLSIDCFDTLFWRRVAKPIDIFYTLNLNAIERVDAEKKARGKKLFYKSSGEVSIEEIYTEMSPEASPLEITSLVEDEIAMEIKYGYAFQPAVNILRIAKQRNIKTIVVSDIYYSAEQLGRLIKAVSPEAFDLIDTIYCSSQYGVGKTNGLWKIVIDKENVKKSHIFHVGDNLKADFLIPEKLGVTANHFLQHERTVEDILSLRENTASILLPECRKSETLPSLFHDWYSIHARGEISSEKILGYGVLGPILKIFSCHIKAQVDKVPGVKVAFLLRDGYMPKLAYDTLFPSEKTYQLRISRLTSIRASFYNKTNIEEYLQETFLPMLEGKVVLKYNMHRIDVLCKHLHFNNAEKKVLVNEIKNNSYSISFLVNHLLSKKISQEIIARSKGFRERLVKHIHTETNIQAGETLMLVDLGYAGTTQNKLAPILERELDINIIGCYLIVSRTPGWHKNRSGVIDPSRYEHRLISTITRFIAAFELLSSSNDFSVSDYEENGTPIGKTDIAESHFARIREVQQHSLDFLMINDTSLENNIFSEKILSDSVIIELARYIYFPLEKEIEWLEQLQFEINLGTDEKISYVDRIKSIDFSRMYGISRIIDGDVDELRTNYSAELRYLGIENAIWLLSSQRFSVGYPINERIMRKQSAEIIFVVNGNTVARNIESMYTYDGFYSLNIPLINDSDIVIMIGKLNGKIEVLNVSFVPELSFSTSSQYSDSTELLLNGDYFIDGASVDGDVVTSVNENAFIYVKKSPHRSNGVINLTYRPLSSKTH